MQSQDDDATGAPAADSLYNEDTVDALEANLSPERSTAVPHPDEVSTFQTAAAVFDRETLIGSGLQTARSWWNESQADPSPGFDPYAYVADNQDEYSDVMGFIRKDGIQDVQSPDQLNARADGWRQKLENQRTLSRGTAAGALLGTGMAFADISTLVPVVGVAGKAGLTYKVASGAALGGGVTAAQEAGLQALDDTRTAHESYMNIGIGTALGGGLGAFGHMVTPTTAERMNVRNPEPQTEYHGTGNGLSDATVTKPLTPEQARGEAPIPDDQVTVGASGQHASAGAAAQFAPSRLDTPRTPIGRAVRKAGQFISQTNPNMRALYMKNDTARRLLIPMSGTPIHTDAAARGVGVQNVDQAKDALNSHLAGVGSFYTRTLNDLNAELGVKRSAGGYYVANQADTVANALSRAGGRTRTKSFNAVSEGSFTETVRHKLLKYNDPDLRKRLVEAHGEDGANQVEASAEQVARRIHQSNKIVEDKMVDLGLLSREEARGENYGMAVLYDRKFAAQKPKQVKVILRKKLATNPDEDFLVDYGFDREQFAALGQREVSIADGAADDGVRTFSTEEGAEIKDDILADWAGTSKDRELEQLEAQHEQAKADTARTKAAALNAYHQTRTSTSGTRKADLSLAREYARQSQRRVERYRRFRENKALERRQLQQEDTQARREQTRVNVTQRDVERQGRIKQLDLQIDEVERRLASLDRQITDANAKMQAAEEAASRAKRLDKEAKRVRKELKDEARKAGTAEKRTARRLRKAEQAKDVNTVVDEIYDAIKGGAGEDAVAAPDHLLGQTGRTKQRRIEWTPEERLENEKLGLIQSDLWGGLGRQYDELSGTLALRQVFANEAAGQSDTAFYQSLRDTLDQSYEDLIEAARAKGDKDAEVAWAKERETASRDLENYLKYHLGQLGRPSDPDSKLYWTAKQLRRYNHTRYGLGFGLSSLPDISTAVLSVGRHIFQPKLLRRAAKNVRGLAHDEVAQIAKSTEMWQMNRSAAFGQYNIDRDLGHESIGVPGSMLSRATGATSNYLDWSSRQVTTFSGMAAWNSMIKTIAGLAQSKKMYDIILDYENIYTKAGFRQETNRKGKLVWRHDDADAARQIGDLSSLGIGAKEAKDIAERLRKFEVEVDEDGVVNFNFQRWFEEGDQADADAAHALLGALQEAQNRAVPTPGAGDRPFLMSHSLWGTLLQFQTYGFVSVSKFLGPLGQRIAYYGDRDAYLSASMALAAGLMVTLAKDGDQERSIDQLAYDAFDRGGFLGFMSSYTSAAKSVFGEQGGSRYQSVSTLGQLLGSSFGLATDATTASGAASQAVIGDGEAAQVWEKSRRLLPYQNLFKLSDAVMAEE